MVCVAAETLDLRFEARNAVEKCVFSSWLKISKFRSGWSYSLRYKCYCNSGSRISECRGSEGDSVYKAEGDSNRAETEFV